MGWGWGSVGRGIGKSACSSLLRCSAFSTWKKQRGLPWQQIPNQHRAHTPLFHTPYHPRSRLLLLLLPGHPPPPPPWPPLSRSRAATSDRPTYGSRDQAQTRDHVQSSTLDPRAGTCASGYWCAADSLPSFPPSSSLFYCCHLLCTQTPQKVICIHSLLSSRFCRLRDVLLPIPVISSTFIN